MTVSLTRMILTTVSVCGCARMRVYVYEFYLCMNVCNNVFDLLYDLQIQDGALPLNIPPASLSPSSTHVLVSDPPLSRLREYPGLQE